MQVKDKELDRLAKQLTAAEAEAAVAASQAAAALLQADADAAAGRQRLVQLEAALKGRDRDVAGLQRQLDVIKLGGDDLQASGNGGRGGTMWGVVGASLGLPMTWHGPERHALLLNVVVHAAGSMQRRVGSAQRRVVGSMGAHARGRA